MPGCSITAGYAIPCKDYVGGIKKIYLGELADFETGVTITSGSVSELPSASVYQWDLKPGSSSATQNVQSDPVAHTVFWEQVAEVVEAAIIRTAGDATDALNFESATRGRWVVFVQDQNDNIFMFGRVRGAEVTAGTIATGQGMGDANGYTFTFTANEDAPAPPLDDFTAVPFDNFVSITVVPGA